MKDLWRSEHVFHVFFTSALMGGDGQLHLPCSFTPGERDPSTHWIGGWVDPRASLDEIFILTLSLAIRITQIL
jgi:hypothetical protein